MTIVNRRTFKLKTGKAGEAAQILLDMCAAWPACTGARVYSSMFGPENDLVAAEYEFEDLSAYGENWAAFNASPLAQEFMARMGPLEAASHHNEIRQSVAATSVDGAGNAVAWRSVIYGQSQMPKLIPTLIAEFVTPAERAVRISVPESGWWGEVTLEVEFESLSEYESSLAEWWVRPSTAAYLEAMGTMVSPGGRIELWQIHR